MDKEEDLLELVRALDGEIDQSFEAVVVEGVIKIRSRSAPSRVVLLLSYPMLHDKSVYFHLIKHRTMELTNQYQGKLVKRDWVIGFSVATAPELHGLKDITFANIPPDCEVLKSTDVKIVVRDKFGNTITAWKDGAPQVSLAEYDGTRTRNWERQEDGVTNWYYDSVRF